MRVRRGLSRRASDALSEVRSDPLGHSDGFWSDFDLVTCADGKQRRVESGTKPLAHGVSMRVGKLRTYGNAIVPQVAAEFVKAFIEVTE